MSKQELAAYLASLVALLDSFDDAGRNRPVWLAAEYNRTYADYRDVVMKENEHETESS